MARGAGAESIEDGRRELLAALAAGRVTGKEVMEELGISAGTLGGWVRAAQLRVEARTGRAGAAFVPVRLAPGSGGVVVEVGEDLRVRAEAGFDAQEVARLVRALRAPC